MEATMTSSDSQRYARTSNHQAGAVGDRQGCHSRAPLRLVRRSSCPTDSRWRTSSRRSRQAKRVFVSQIQGRTYANIFRPGGTVHQREGLELSHEHWFGDQIALEALVRFSDEELKHQELFRRIDG
jgi:hypothetical protein